MKQVDKLEFTVLVDNCIEWISTLPPGFTHELPQQLSRKDTPRDPLTKLPVGRFEDFCCGAHGLAIHLTTTIDGRTSSVLIDAGPEGLSIERNARAMQTPLHELDALVLSHWHRDHSGGIVRALELRAAMLAEDLPPLTVDLHPVRPIRRGIAPPPKYVPIANWLADPSFDEITLAGGRVDLHDEEHEIKSRNGAPTGVSVSGEIPRRYTFERGLPGAVTWMDDEATGESGWFTDETISDERYVTVDVRGRGLVVFSSCSHAGICNVLADAIERYDRPVYMVVGGLHLVPVEQQPVQQTVDFLARRLQPTPRYILPLHCTGLGPRATLREAMGDACIPAGVGMRVVVDADDAAEEALDELTLRIIE